MNTTIEDEFFIPYGFPAFSNYPYYDFDEEHSKLLDIQDQSLISKDDNLIERR